MYTDLKGKVAVITGGSKGIGNAIARRLSAEKMKVVINYHSDKEGAEETVDELKKVGGEAVAVEADVSSE
ncbi:SDR family NAD(P)-dependent oxidoreductase, partial [Carnobacterium jeotgali]